MKLPTQIVWTLSNMILRVIINPSSGSGKGLNFEKEFKQHLEKVSFIRGKDDQSLLVQTENSTNNPNNYEFKSVGHDGEVNDILDSWKDDFALENITTVLVVVGGDGFLNVVLNSLNRQSNDGTIVLTDRLVLFNAPYGTGNDYFKFLYEDQCPFSIPIFLSNLQNLNFKNVSIGKATISENAYPETIKYFLNVASVGYSAKIAFKAQGKKRFGKFTYWLKSFFSIFGNKKFPMSVTIQNEDNDENTGDFDFLVAVGLGKYFGGGKKICPDAKVGNKSFSVTAMKNATLMKMLHIDSFLRGHRKPNSDNIFLKPATIVTIKSNGKCSENMYAEFDGEVVLLPHNFSINIEMSKPIKFVMLEKQQSQNNS